MGGSGFFNSEFFSVEIIAGVWLPLGGFEQTKIFYPDGATVHEGLFDFVKVSARDFFNFLATLVARSNFLDDIFGSRDVFLRAHKPIIA